MTCPTCVMLTSGPDWLGWKPPLVSLVIPILLCPHMHPVAQTRRLQVSRGHRRHAVRHRHDRRERGCHFSKLSIRHAQRTRSQPKVDVLTDRSKNTGVIFGELAFASESEFALWMTSVNPSGSGLAGFVDLINLYLGVCRARLLDRHCHLVQ